MNKWILAVALAVLIYLQIKMLKGIFKIICGVMIPVIILLLINYFLLPQFGHKPFNIGLEKFFQLRIR